MEVCQAICLNLDSVNVERNLDVIVEAAKNHGVYEYENPKLLETHVKEITNLLHQKTTRVNALKLLIPAIEQSPKDILTSQGLIWFQMCNSIIISNTGASSKRAACHAVTLLLERLPKLPELQRQLSKMVTSVLVKALAGANSSWSAAAFRCLKEYMLQLPIQCLPHKEVIQTVLLKKLDTPLTCVGRGSEVSGAGQAYASLVLAGVGSKGADHAEARSRQITPLLCLAHHLLDFLLDGVVEKQSYAHPRKYELKLTPLQSFCLPTDVLMTRMLAITRLMNTLKFIAEMVTCESNDLISIEPNSLLGPVFRLLQVETSALNRYKGNEHKILTFFLPALHQQALLTLRDFIVSIPEAIDLYFGPMAELMTATLKSHLKTNAQALATGGQQTRIVAYITLTTLIEVSRGRDPPSSELIDIVMEDIMPKNQQFTIKGYGTKGLTNLNVQKKSRNKGYAVTAKDSVATNDPLARYENFGRVIGAALGLAEALFRFATHSMTLLSRQVLQRKVLAVADRVLNSSQVPTVFQEETTRVQLFKTLSSMAENPDPKCPMPYTIILQLLQQGLHDSRMSVVNACQAGIKCISFITSNPQISFLTQVFEELLPKAIAREMKDAEGGEKEVEQDNMEKEKEEEEEEEEEENIQIRRVQVNMQEQVAEEDADADDKMEEDVIDDNAKQQSPQVRRTGKRTATDLVESPQKKIMRQESESDNEVEENEIYEDEDSNDIPGSSKEVEAVREEEEEDKNMEKDEESLSDGIKNKEEVEAVAEKKLQSKNMGKNEESREDTGKEEEESTHGGPSLEEMLSSFVDAEPDA